MTHYNSLIKQLRDFTPTTAKTKKARKTLLRSLYTIERKEPRKRRVRKTTTPNKQRKNESFFGFLTRHATQATVKGVQHGAVLAKTAKQKGAESLNEYQLSLSQ